MIVAFPPYSVASSLRTGFNCWQYSHHSAPIFKRTGPFWRAVFICSSWVTSTTALVPFFLRVYRVFLWSFIKRCRYRCLHHCYCYRRLHRCYHSSVSTAVTITVFPQLLPLRAFPQLYRYWYFHSSYRYRCFHRRFHYRC